MAINCYCGVMGSGKSYEVVSGPLLDAVAAGRRVVTNIDGVNEDLIHAYLASKRGLDVSKLGRIVHVTTGAVNEPDFFPVENEAKEGATVTPGFVRAGDLVVIDEAWKLWAQDCKIPKEHIAFFRMHRHFVHEHTGVSCDVVMMVQAIGDLHRMLKPVVELSFRMVKLKSVGMPSKYRVEMYEGWKQNKTARTGTFVRSYKKEIFPLYKSYAGKAGKEAQVDRRQNILANKSIWVIAAGLFVCCCLALRFLWAFFHPHPKGDAAAVAASAAAAKSSASAPMLENAASPTAGRSGSFKGFSDTWRIVGGYSTNGVAFVVVADQAGYLRVESPSAFQNYGAAQVGVIDGERVSTFSGGKIQTVAAAVTK
ncbi:zonular occludens toxin domain-containing protein [Caballeronia sp. AZ7_KS35]|uniref:zonular occludens toxin domain-containing protein n=1 Tax=Caballeronia sp. AZ7_KS35 TaxID=2921762 RepID=UPI002027CEFE|nr:zonular occludens toxin domain-containing protein [Caballeronia sp. AZ7_KS35]